MDSTVINYASIFGHSLFLEGNNISIVSAEDIVLYPMESTTINTGITLYLTDKCSGILVNKQHQAKNKILMPMAGLVLNGVSNIQVHLFNLGINPYKIKAGITAIATVQLVNKLAITKEIVLEKDSNDKQSN